MMHSRRKGSAGAASSGRSSPAGTNMGKMVIDDERVSTSSPLGINYRQQQQPPQSSSQSQAQSFQDRHNNNKNNDRCDSSSSNSNATFSFPASRKKWIHNNTKCCHRQRFQIFILCLCLWAVFILLRQSLNLYNDFEGGRQKEHAAALQKEIVSFYHGLHLDEISKRDPRKVESLAVHRPLGNSSSTLTDYALIYTALVSSTAIRVASSKVVPASLSSLSSVHAATGKSKTTTITTLQNKNNYENNNEDTLATDLGTSGEDALSRIKIADAGCGLGAGLLWLHQREPTWDLHGYNLSPDQVNFMKQHVLMQPKQQNAFEAYLKSFDELKEREQYHGIFSIEALVHAPDFEVTLRHWSENHLLPGGRVVLIDDYVAEDRDLLTDEDVEGFRSSWRIPSLTSVTGLERAAHMAGLRVIQQVDLGALYDVIGVNYKNQIPEIPTNVSSKKEKTTLSPPWLGAKYRQRLTVSKRLRYMMFVLEKPMMVSR